MAIAYLIISVYLCIIELMESSHAIGLCDGQLTGHKMAAMLNRTHPPCRDKDLRFELPICEIGEDDVGDTCSASAQALPPLPACEDGTWNRTCYPVTTHNVNYHMKCMCHSFVHIPGDVRATYWSDLEALSPPVDGAFYTRRLMMEGGECIAQEFVKMGAVVKAYDLPDSVYTASSSYSSNVLPYKARLDAYIITGLKSCAWVYASGDTDKWLGITLPKKYFIKGCVISRKCYEKHVTMVTVTTSGDDATWRDVTVEEDLSARYDSDDAAYIWFSTIYTSRYWKIFMLSESHNNPRVKADLIGQEA